MGPRAAKTTAWQSWKEYREDEEYLTELPKGGDLPWALFYPADYSVGAASLGYHYVYRRLKESGVAAERFFSEPAPFRSVEGDTLLERFPVITASIAYEGNAEVFFKWLHSANIPLKCEERASGGYPIIGAGGAMTYINPLLLSAVCDFIVLGDALEILPFTVSALRDYVSAGDKERLLERLASHPSILVPSRHISEGRVAVKRKLANDMPLDCLHPKLSTWITPRSAFGATVLAELQRGCVRGCSYCTLPHCFGRVRHGDLADITKELDAAFAMTKAEQVGLVTPEAGDYPYIADLLDFLESRGKGVSFASLRIDRLTEKMVSALTRGGRHSLTAAPETGSDDLRHSCGKKFTNEMIIEKMEMARSLGIERAKLYFMVGLPGEGDGDIGSIADLTERIVARTGLDLTLSVNPFVPKPGTAWEKQAFAGVREIKRKYDLLSDEISKKIKKKRPKLRFMSPKEGQNEFSLAWYGYNESALLAGSKGILKNVPAIQGTREKTLLELERLW